MEDADKTKAAKAPATGPKDPRSRVGTVLAGRYRILRLLGEGAQGSVYVGEHLRIGRKDAIKVLQPALLKDEDAVARFRRGASKASHINHPNVCTVYDFGETEEGLPFMASEFVEGKELHDVLRTDAPMKLERAVDLLEQTAAGLTAAHDLNIVHRDLKPANVMLTRGRRGREVVKVVDFDIAKGIGEAEAGGGLTQAGWIIGTPQYMSPEQITASDIDARSDVYSLALIFFEMLTGKLPNEVGSTQKLMWQRVSGDLKRLDEALPGRRFPPGLQEALDRALAKDPEDRPASAVDFAREARQALEAAPGLSEEDLATAVAPAPGLEATRVAQSPAVPSTRLAPEDAPPPVPATRAAPDQAPGAVPATRLADGAADPRKGAGGGSTRPAWASTPVLAGVAGVVLVGAAAGAWGTGLIGGSDPPVLANLPGSPLTLEVGGDPLLLAEVRLEDADGRPVAGASLSLVSRDPSIVRTAGREITPASPGGTWVVASAGEVTDSVRVEVRPREETIAQGGDNLEPEDSTSGPRGGGGPGTPDSTQGGGRVDGGDQRGQDTSGGGDDEVTRSVSAERINGVYQTILLAENVEQFSPEEQRSFREDAEAAFGQLELPPATRARAAWIVAQFHDEGNAEYCRWARRAVQIEPNHEGYRALATPCGQ